jgi:tRNA G18 (ribose-2'-O)-methylase SpoU
LRSSSSSHQTNTSKLPVAQGELVFGSHCVMTALQEPIARNELYTLYVQDSHIKLLQQTKNNNKQSKQQNSNHDSQQQYDDNDSNNINKRMTLKDELRLKHILLKAQKFNLQIKQLSKQKLNQLSHDRPHNGLILDCSQLPIRMLKSSRTNKQQSQSELQEWQSKYIRPGQVWLFCDSLVDPQNLGAILRSAAFLNANGVLIAACELVIVNNLISNHYVVYHVIID